MSRPDEALLQLWSRFIAHQREWDEPHAEFGDEEWERRSDLTYEMIAQLIAAEATTPAGIVAKLKAAIIDADEGDAWRWHIVLGQPAPLIEDTTWACNLMRSAIADLERLAQEARP